MLEKGKAAIGAWYGVDDKYYDDRRIQAVTECGIDFVFTGYNHDERSEQILKSCEKYGLGLILFDWKYYQRPERYGTDTVEQSLDHISSPAVIGHALFDEPNCELYDTLEHNRSVYKARFPDKLAYMNLLPLIHDTGRFGASSYEEYVELYAKKVNSDFISVDIYPLVVDNGREYLHPDYINNLSVVADACRRYGREFWCFIQSMPFNIVRRAPSEADIRFEFYSLLAFGAKKILHFCYATPPSGSEQFPYAMTDIYGEKTPLWHFCKTVNYEFRAFRKIYERYDYIGTYSYKTEDVPDYLSFRETADAQSLSALNSDGCLLVGCFESPSGKGYIVTNMSRLEDHQNVSFSFIPRADAVAYIKGLPQKLEKDADGCVHLTLESGEGVFVEDRAE